MLELFYSNPNRSFYVREITRKIDEQINSVRRELANLLNTGIITSETTNNKLYYEVNQSYEYYKPLSTIFNKTGKKAATAKVKPEAVAADDSLKQLGNIDLALYTGQFTRDESTGIDFLIVGNVNQNQVDKYVAELERQENKQIRYAILSKDDFEYRQKIKDRFVVNVLAAKKQILIDKHDIFSS